MGLFDRLKKKKAEALVAKAKENLEKTEDINEMFKAVKPLFETGILNENNMFAEDLEHLDENGELPFGWFVNSPDIEEKDRELGNLISRYVYLRDNKGAVDDKIASINAVISYLEAYRNYCYNKNGCYIKYFSDQYEHCHNSKCDDFPLIANYQGFLKELLDNYDNLKLQESLVKTLPDDLLKYLKEHNNIMQKDVYKAFDKVIKGDIQSLLYQWAKSGIIKREKEGNSYRITII